MAIAAGVQWEARPSGNDTNGGGFVAGASGTDYSQQDAAQVAYTDLAIDAVTNTKLTSAGNPFTAAHVGNILNVTGGSGFTAGRYQVVSVAGAVATMDSAVGTVGSTSGTGNLGGGLATISQGITLLNSVGTNVWIKNGTFNITAAVTTVQVSSVVIQGYDLVHGDNTGNRPTIKATGGSNFYMMSGDNSGPRSGIVFANFIVDGNNTTGVRGCNLYDTNNIQCSIIRVLAKNCPNYGIYAASNNLMAGCYATNCSGAGLATNAACLAVGCHADAQAANQPGWELFGASMFVNCLATAQNGAAGFKIDTSVTNCWFFNCTSAYNAGGAAGDGWFMGAGATACKWVNCIAYNNAHYGFNYTSGGNALSAFWWNTALGANSTGNRNTTNSLFTLNDLALTASPFTNGSASAGGDYTPNNTNGGGTVIRNAGFPGQGSSEAILGSGMSSAGLDIGALQHFL